MIQNPDPVTPGTFDGMWISRMALAMPNLQVPEGFREREGSFFAALLPWDGTHLLSTGARYVEFRNLASEMAESEVVASLVATLASEAGRLAGKEEPVDRINIAAADPTKPVLVNCRFSSGETYLVRDAYALAAKDAEFAVMFSTAMAGIASLANLVIGD